MLNIKDIRNDVIDEICSDYEIITKVIEDSDIVCEFEDIHRVASKIMENIKRKYKIAS